MPKTTIAPPLRRAAPTLVPALLLSLQGLLIIASCAPGFSRAYGIGRLILVRRDAVWIFAALCIFALADRIDALSPGDPGGLSYQVARSMDAIRDGGFLGFRGEVDPTLIPNSLSDFFFSLIPYASGILGTAVALALAAWYVHGALRASESAASGSAARIIIGLSAFIGIWFLAGAFTALGLLPPNALGVPLARNDHALLPGFFLAGIAAGSSGRPRPDGAAKGEARHRATVALWLAFCALCLTALIRTIAVACA